MKIIIPMSGLGSRFKNAGYKDVKPLIEVQGRPIIEWVVSMFSPEDEIIFICRKDHLQETSMEKTLKRIHPSSEIIGIDGHKKGPVYAVAQAFDFIKEDEPVLISYCDYYMHWDYKDFKKNMNEGNFAGAIPCYSGFHPHLLPAKNLYAGCKVDNNNNLLEIREKFSFEKDKTKGLHSPGVYYFQSGTIVKKYFQKMLDIDLNLNGEYYVSLIYQIMLEDKLPISVYNKVTKFCQWGTPEDLQDYLFWTNMIKGFKK